MFYDDTVVFVRKILTGKGRNLINSGRRNMVYYLGPFYLSRGWHDDERYTKINTRGPTTGHLSKFCSLIHKVVERTSITDLILLKGQGGSTTKLPLSDQPTHPQRH